MEDNILIECRELTKVYSRGKETPVRAVDGVELKVSNGEFLAIVGRSGTGKSTLLNLIGGLDQPTSGTVILDGKALDKISDRELALVRREKIGFVFQDFNLLPGYTAYENIEIALAPGQLSTKERRGRVENLLHAFELADRANHLPRQLSVGQQQRLAIARALVNNPVLILADEPTGGVDPTTAKEVVDRLVELNRRSNVTLIVTTHSAFPYHLASRVVYMKDGRMVSQEEAGY